jgi:hypothetical protein
MANQDDAVPNSPTAEFLNLQVEITERKLRLFDALPMAVYPNRTPIWNHLNQGTEPEETESVAADETFSTATTEVEYEDEQPEEGTGSVSSPWCNAKLSSELFDLLADFPNPVPPAVTYDVYQHSLSLAENSTEGTRVLFAMLGRSPTLAGVEGYAENGDATWDGVRISLPGEEARNLQPDYSESFRLWEYTPRAVTRLGGRLVAAIDYFAMPRLAVVFKGKETDIEEASFKCAILGLAMIQAFCQQNEGINLSVETFINRVQAVVIAFNGATMETYAIFALASPKEITKGRMRGSSYRVRIAFQQVLLNSVCLQSPNGLVRGITNIRTVQNWALQRSREAKDAINEFYF